MKNNFNYLLIVAVAVVVSVISPLLTVNFMQKDVSLSPGVFDSTGGPSLFKSDWHLQGMFQSTTNAGGIGLKSIDNKQFEIQSVQAGGIPNTAKSGLIIYDRNAEQYRQVITSDGNVGIGKTNPENKLDVNGGIKADGIAINSLTTNSIKLNRINLTGNRRGEQIEVYGGIEATSSFPGMRPYVNVTNPATKQALTIYPDLIISNRDNFIRFSINENYISLKSPDGRLRSRGPTNTGAWVCV